MAFFDNIKFPFFTLQELNLDWLLAEVKRIAGFMPQDGNVGDILTRKSGGAEWEPPDAVQVDIDGLPEDTQIMDNDQLIFYDISQQANRKIKPPNLLDSMCSNGTPYMNGTGSAGTSKKPSRYDHVHPTDTSRQAALSGTQMNAVNSGAPANCFSSGKLNVANGGTGESSIADFKRALGIHEFYADHFDIPANDDIDVTVANNTAGFVMTSGGNPNTRGIFAYNVSGAGSVTFTPMFNASGITLTGSTNNINIANGTAGTARALIIW